MASSNQRLRNFEHVCFDTAQIRVEEVRAETDSQGIPCRAASPLWLECAEHLGYMRRHT